MKTNDYDPVASLYDTYVPATFDIDFFLNETRKAKGEVLELMSGTGRISIPLLEAGVKLTCMDLSAELNAVFREKLAQKGLKADIHTMDVCELDLGKKFEMVIIPFHSFAHITSPEDQRRALERIHAHLAAGGTFICTLGNPAVRKQAVNGQLRLFRTYPLDDGGSLLLWVLEDFSSEDNQVVEAFQFFEEYDAKGALKSKKLVELHFRLTGKDEFEELARAAGFRPKAFYGDYNCAEFNPENSPFMIWIMETAGSGLWVKNNRSAYNGSAGKRSSKKAGNRLPSTGDAARKPLRTPALRRTLPTFAGHFRRRRAGRTQAGIGTQAHAEIRTSGSHRHPGR